MLEQLVRYAERNGLVVEPGFAPKSVRFTLMFSRSGRFVSVASHADSPREFPQAPEMSFSDLKALKGGGAHFLVDALQVITLLGVEDLNGSERSKVEAKHTYFVGMLQEAANVLPELAGVASELVRPTALEAMRAEAVRHKAKPTDKATIMIGNDYPVVGSAWHGWWREFRSRIRPEEAVSNGSRMRCFATGDLVTPAPTHPKVTGLGDVGALAMGAPLVGFDKEAFLSYGLKQSENAAVSELAASKYRAALNYLLRSPTNSQRLGKAVRVVYWFRDNLPVEDDPLADVFGSGGSDEVDDAAEAGANTRAGKEWSSPYTGTRGALYDTRFYSMVVSGAAGRVMIRDWTTLQFGELRANLDQWFKDLTIVHRDGGKLVRCVKIRSLSNATVREMGDAPAELEACIWRALIRGTPIAREAMAMALARIKLDIVNGNGFNHARFALQRAYHVRKNSREREIDAMLNLELKDDAYHCGRLMAVLAALQRTALPDVGAGVVQRFYAAASATPGLVIGRLVRLSRFHLSTVEQKNPGLAFWYDSHIAEIMDRIQTIPPTLNVEKQSLFALGYYQQIAHDRTPRATKQAAVPTNEAPAIDEASNDISTANAE